MCGCRTKPGSRQAFPLQAWSLRRSIASVFVLFCCQGWVWAHWEFDDEDTGKGLWPIIWQGNVLLKALDILVAWTISLKSPGIHRLLKTTNPEVCVSGQSEDKCIGVPSLNLTPESDRFYITLDKQKPMEGTIKIQQSHAPFREI